jgi:hypothetical protein
MTDSSAKAGGGAMEGEPQAPQANPAMIECSSCREAWLAPAALMRPDP